MTVVLKLGGSVITQKDQPETLDHPTIERAVGSIAAADLDRLVLVHGGGSFGHAAAAAHDVSHTAGTRDATAVREIHAAMGRLNEAVIDRLAGHGVPAVPGRPLSAAARENDGRLSLAAEPVETLLAEGFVPVLHGDIVGHREHGATILSGDEIVSALAGFLDVDRVGLCSTVSGVLDQDGAPIGAIEAIEDVEHLIGEADTTDVTGGMAGKVRALLGLEAPADVFGLDDLDAFLAGESPGTRVR
jgi:isopentenyl phosphate kinase